MASYNTKKRRINQVIYDKDQNAFIIEKQEDTNVIIDNDYDLLKPSQSVINLIRSKSVDWELTDANLHSTLFIRQEYNQYKNWIIEFGKMDIRIIPNIQFQVLFRQTDEAIDDGFYLEETYQERFLWEVTTVNDDINKLADVKLHVGIYIDPTEFDTRGPYEVKLLIDIINPLEYV